MRHLAAQIRKKGFLSSVVRTSALLLRGLRSDVEATSGNAELSTSVSGALWTPSFGGLQGRASLRQEQVFNKRL